MSEKILWIYLIGVTLLLLPAFYFLAEFVTHTEQSKKSAFESANFSMGYKADYDLTDQHHVIVLGKGANANQSYEFVFKLDDGYTIRTIMSPDEHEVILRVLKRAMQDRVKEGKPKDNQVLSLSRKIYFHNPDGSIELLEREE